ncbi:delta-like protein 1 [Ruditapes philippinarum]|uniref:delta-like protein 1 n=1 Tax=Ruditapes philippinarum TaxID=129788 RepID=UPI00295BAAAF|nr:delta-like protein 1 [Ruditapes philippinarum]
MDIKLFSIILATLTKVVLSATYFELRLIKFENPSGRESDGDCCDFPCSDPCDPDIVVCFDKPGAKECSKHKRFTGHYHANSFHFGPNFENGEMNPMTVLFEDKWQNTLYITVKVEDRDSINANDPMGRVRLLFTRAPAPSKKEALWNNLDFVFDYQTITGQARVYCEQNYYGEDCMTHCVPKNVVGEGHYTCAKNGSKVCMENYHGPDCKVHCIPADDDTGHYYCDENGEAVCLEGWRGDNCTEDIDECNNGTNNPCWPNGECVNTDGSYTCNCSKPYTGPNCQEQIIYCNDALCSNHSVCNNTAEGFQCLCDPGWTGTLCDRRVTPCTSDPCQNGGKCVLTLNRRNYLCRCEGLWMGRNCTEPVVQMLNDTKVIFLSGNLPEDQWDDLTLGIRHLLKDLLQISDVAIETTITYPNEKQTRVEVFVESQDPQVRHSLDKILVLPAEEVKTSFILPLSEKQELIREHKLKPDPWVKKHWYVVLTVVLSILIILTIVVVVMYFAKKRKRSSSRKMASLNGPRSASGRESLPDAAIGFDNSLYFESNQPEKVRGLPEIPKQMPHENGRKF